MLETRLPLPVYSARTTTFAIALLLAWLSGGPALAEALSHTVTLRTIKDRKAVFATVESRDVTDARARIGGTIRDLVVDEGSAVTAGQRIATIRDPKLRLRIATVDARIRAREAQRALAILERARIGKLRRSGTVSQSQLDEVTTKLAVVRGELAALAAERSVIVEEKAEGDVLAPSDGRVLKVHVTNGTVVQPGDRIATVTVDAYLLRLRLPERHARFIKKGDRVLIGPRGMQIGRTRLRTGRVEQVYPRLDNGRVVADVNVPGLGDFFVGERIRVYVETGKRPAIVVPADFIRRRSGVAYARLRNGREIVVQLGLPTEDGIEILSGLNPGDELIKP